MPMKEKFTVVHSFDLRFEVSRALFWYMEP